MAFVIGVGFATEHDRQDFLERALPRLRGHQTDPPAIAPTTDSPLHWVGVAVTSPSAARDLCHQLVSFLAKAKNERVNVVWQGADGEPQIGEAASGAAREAEVLAVRLGASAKAHIDGEKAAAARQ